MAGLLPSFLSSAQLEVRMGDTVLAYCQNLSWTDDMTTVPVGGIGSYSFHALEPVGYIGRGSMTITHFSTAIFNVLKKIPDAVPENLRSAKTQDAGDDNSKDGRDGNSLLVKEFFNPVQLLVSRTFDINIYERAFGRNPSTKDIETNETKRVLYTLKDCRMTNLSFTFTPGTLINQVASFLCLSVIDHTVEDSFKYTLPPPPPKP